MTKGFDLFYKHICIILSNHTNECGVINFQKMMEILPNCRMDKSIAKEIIKEMEKRGLLERMDSIHSPRGQRFKVKKVSTLN